MRLVLLVILCSILFTGCTLQSGYTRDKLHGYDRGVTWNHIYLLNDHTTVYCWEDNIAWGEILEKAKADNNITLEIDYEKYWLKGSLCSSGQDMEAVVVTDIKIV